jgi:hypothetical protein
MNESGLTSFQFSMGQSRPFIFFKSTPADHLLGKTRSLFSISRTNKEKRAFFINAQSFVE